PTARRERVQQWWFAASPFLSPPLRSTRARPVSPGRSMPSFVVAPSAIPSGADDDVMRVMLKVHRRSLSPLPANEEGAGTGRTSPPRAWRLQSEDAGRARSAL